MGACTPSFVGLTHRVKRRQYILHSKPGVFCRGRHPKSSCAKEFLCNLVRGPELNSPRSGNILNHKQHRYVSSPSQTDPPSLLG